MGNYCLTVHTSGLVLALATVAGCAGYDGRWCEGENCGDQFQTIDQTAISESPNDFVPWQLTNGQLRLCARRDSSVTEAELTPLRDRLITVINATWGQVPGMDFVSGCTSPAMEVTFYNDGEGGGGWGRCGFGRGADCEIHVADPADVASIDGTAVHEIGHGLGLHHEHQSPLAPPLCAAEQDILNGCQQCTATTCTAAQANACWFAVLPSSSINVNSGDRAVALSQVAAGNSACLPCSQGSCQVGSCGNNGCTPAASYWGCFGANPTGGTILLTSADRSKAADRVDDRTVMSDAVGLTFFDPLSIMNYCAAANGRRDHRPTLLDLLGMEILYSTNRVYGLGCDEACFKLAGGNVVTSTTGSITSEWVGRGAYLNQSFKVTGTSSWVMSYPVTTLPAGNTTLTYTQVDGDGNTRNGSGTVRKLNSDFAAIASALTTIR